MTVEREVEPEGQRDLERFENDALYFDRHFEDLLRQYPEQWVAIFNQEVVGAAKDLDKLLRQLDRKGLPRGEVYVEYLTDKEETLILAWQGS